jgi:hypothetical protein
VDCRAILFVDGSNWYHGLRAEGVTNQMQLSWVKIAQKLTSPRVWTGVRYYIGEVQQQGNPLLYANQRRFISRFRAEDTRMSVHFGRLETRWQESDAAADLAEYLGRLKTRIDRMSMATWWTWPSGTVGCWSGPKRPLTSCSRQTWW